MKSLNYRLPKTKVGDATFKKIIRTGKKLFAKHGFQATSINDIIAKSKVAAGTFYLYFDNKLALYMYLLEEYKKEIRLTSATAVTGYQTRFEIEREGFEVVHQIRPQGSARVQIDLGIDVRRSEHFQRIL
ncbi:MAG: TetR/AcrR family transcriptional regulator [Bacillus subtilis]|nr:TetR/AcrR family transcriptional regulator [Bacillus subtilis]